MRLGAANLGHQFPGRPPLFTGLNFSVSPGELVGLVGPSGSGKSTLLSLLAGFEAPRYGSVLREGINRVGWVFQNPVGVPRRSALDHVVYPLLTQGTKRTDAEILARELLKTFGLVDQAETPFSQLSGGEAQRLMLARAVASPFDALLVDEPTAQLDPLSAGTVIDVVRGLSSSGRITLIASHDPSNMHSTTCTRVTFKVSTTLCQSSRQLRLSSLTCSPACLCAAWKDF
ncbi:ATP-binding cassette domain-containing protein [Paenarthrobacter nitroguajacolicus]|uniref:ATP-binding cassette domain-containing protein n=1 Tax=Paenarthrobacter nitroguajacolicus TaxID=211146 RepID=UPI003ADE61DB